MPPTALFAIDIQHSLALHPSTSIPHAARVLTAGTALLARARSSIDSARSAGSPPSVEVVLVQHEEPASQGVLQRGSEAWGLAFPPREGERVVRKDVRDTFTSNPRLAAELKDSGVRTIEAFGIQSECCVLSTCRGALKAGFEVVLLRGAHSTYDVDGKTAEEVEREVEEVLEREGARVVEWEAWRPRVVREMEGKVKGGCGV